MVARTASDQVMHPVGANSDYPLLVKASKLVPSIFVAKAVNKYMGDR